MPQKSEHTSAFDSASLCNFLCWTAQELHGRLEHGLLAILRSARVQAIARTNVPLGRGIRFTVHYASYVPVMTPRFEAAKDAEDDPARTCAPETRVTAVPCTLARMVSSCHSPAMCIQARLAITSSGPNLGGQGRN